MPEFRVIYLISREEGGYYNDHTPDFRERLSSQVFPTFEGAFRYGSQMAKNRKPRVFMEIKPNETWGDIAK